MLQIPLTLDQLDIIECALDVRIENALNELRECKDAFTCDLWFKSIKDDKELLQKLQLHRTVKF